MELEQTFLIKDLSSASDEALSKSLDEMWHRVQHVRRHESVMAQMLISEVNEREAKRVLAISQRLARETFALAKTARRLTYIVIVIGLLQATMGIIQLLR